MHEHAGDDQYVLASLSASARCDEGRGVPAALHVGLLLHRGSHLTFQTGCCQEHLRPPADLFYNLIHISLTSLTPRRMRLLCQNGQDLPLYQCVVHGL